MDRRRFLLTSLDCSTGRVQDEMSDIRYPSSTLAQRCAALAVALHALGLAALGGCALAPAVVPTPERQVTTKAQDPPVWFLFVLREGRWAATKYTVEGDCRASAFVPRTFRYCLPAGVLWKQVWFAHTWLEGTTRWSRSTQAFPIHEDCEALVQRMRAAGHVATCERVY